MSPPRLAVVATHPIQYYAPLFRRLAEGGAVNVRVFYEWEGAARGPALDRAFGETVAWDVPLLEGYPHEFVPNVSDEPGTHHRAGIDNPDLVARIQAWEPDAVLIYGWPYRSHLQALRVFHGRVPVLFRGDSTLLDERSGPRRWARRLALRWVYRHVDLALVVGQNNRAYFRAHGLGEDQLVWAPHSIDAERFADPTGEREAEARRWRADLGIPAEAVVFVFAGKLEPKKAPGVLLDAFLGASAPGAHLVFVGSGPLGDDLEVRARSVGDGRVHFVGFQNQSRMPTAYRLGDVLVLPSRGPGETWGLAVNEAFACGRPALVSDRVGCAPDLVTESETGAVVPAGDVVALRGAIERMASHPGALRRMGKAARRRIEDWSIERQAAVVERVVHELAAS